MKSHLFTCLRTIETYLTQAVKRAGHLSGLLRSLILASSLLAVTANGQTDSIIQKKVDSLRAKLQKDSTRIYRFQLVRPYLNIDNRNSFINKAPVNFKGTQIGIILFEKHTMGMGFYNINQNSKKPIAVIDGTVSATKVLTMNYFTFFYQYTLLDKKYFELDVPVEIGLGGCTVSYSDSSSKKTYRQSSGAIVPLGIGLQGIIKPIKWVGLSLLIGYRMVAEKNVSQNFNGIYSSIGLNFDLRQIMRDTKYYWFKRKSYTRHVRKILKKYGE